MVHRDLLLTPIQLDHAQALFQLVDGSREFLRMWLPWVDMVHSVADQIKYIQYYQRKYELERALTCTIVYQGQVAGVISVNAVDSRRRLATIGYWLGQDFWGRQIMSQSCRSLIHSIFQTLNLHKIAILCAQKNLASQRIPLRLSFVQEGLIRDGELLQDCYHDLLIYGLLRSEFYQRNQLATSPGLGE